MRMGKINELGEKCNAEVIGADLTSIEEIENLYEKSLSKMNGKIDFILHSVGMSPNVRKKKEYGDLNYDWLNKTLDVSAISFHKMLQVAEKNNVLNENYVTIKKQRVVKKESRIKKIFSNLMML